MKQRSIETARRLLDDPTAVILDTETTGFGSDAEVLKIAIIDMQGEVLLNTLVKPCSPVDETGGAYLINRIGNDRLAEAPTFGEVWPQVCNILDGRNAIAYNADFDNRMLWQGAKRRGGSIPPLCGWHCAMRLYSEFALVPFSRGLNWFRLTEACEREGVTVSNAHDGAGDCLMTLGLLKAMARGESI